MKGFIDSMRLMGRIKQIQRQTLGEFIKSIEQTTKEFESTPQPHNNPRIPNCDRGYNT